MGKLVKNGVNYTGGDGVSSYNALSDQPSINGVLLAGNKSSDDLGIITKAVNDLTNYYNKTSSYSKAEVDTMIAAAKNGRFIAVATLPTTDIQTNVIYLVPSSDPETGNVKDEYINLDGTTAGWEKIGNTDIDLALSALSDVNITSPTNNQVLKYNSTSGKWENGTGGGSGGGGGGHTIEDSTGTDLTQRDTLQFGEGFLAEDDSTNEKTIVTPDVMQSGDMDDVITPLPSVQTRYQKYSTEEQVVAEWIDGKPIYQKTIQITMPTCVTEGIPVWDTINLNFTVDSLIDIKGFFTSASTYKMPIPFVMQQGDKNVTAVGIRTIIQNSVQVLQFYNSNPAWNGTIGYATIQYTKTT